VAAVRDLGAPHHRRAAARHRRLGATARRGDGHRGLLVRAVQARRTGTRATDGGQRPARADARRRSARRVDPARPSQGPEAEPRSRDRRS
jgi:hypothetical protein